MTRHVRPLPALAVAAALLLAACASAAPTPSPGFTAPPATPGPASATPAAATATATTPPSTSSPTPVAPAGFSCSYPFVRAATSNAVVQVRNIRLGAHPIYDRIVFDLDGTGLPVVHLDRGTPPFTADPSGLPLEVAGTSFIVIRLDGAAGGGYATDGTPTYTGPRAFSPSYPRLVSLVEQGDFEAQFSWIAGFRGPVCYRVLTMADPTRLIVDFAAAG